MEKVRTSLIILVIIGIGIFAYLTIAPFVEKKSETSSIDSQSTQQQQVSPVSSSTTTSTNSWKTYSSTPLGFSISHPSDLEPIKQDETIVFSKWGPSQKEETEFYDGISLTLSAGFYNGAFESLVNQQLEEIKNWPTYVSSSEIKALSLAGKEAYSFETVTMGKATYYFIKKNQTEYFKIVDATNDPTNQGFDTIISRMMSSLQI